MWPDGSSRPVLSSGTLTQQPSLLALGLPQLVWLVQGLVLGTVLGSLIIGYARNPSLEQQLFYAILNFALSEAFGLLCLMVAFLILFAM
ncbi:ATP synthase F(0) complex subunit C2, mitochondrial [Vulpes lagopus]